MKKGICELLVVGLAVYNIWYGAFCWSIGGVPGLLFGSSIMVAAGIIGVMLRRVWE